MDIKLLCWAEKNCFIKHISLSLAQKETIFPILPRSQVWPADQPLKYGMSDLCPLQDWPSRQSYVDGLAILETMS